MSTLSPEEAKALALKLEKTSEGLNSTLEELKTLDQTLNGNLPNQDKPKLKAKKEKKSSQPLHKENQAKETFTLEFDKLTAQDFATIAELREAQTFVNFMDYYNTIAEDPKRHLTALFKKVTFKKGDKSFDLGSYAFYGEISPDELEKSFYKTVENRREYFEVDGDFNYSRSVRLKKESDFVRRDLSLKAYLAHRFPKEVLAMSALMGCTSDTIGLLFQTFSSIDGKREAIEKKYQKSPNDPKKIEELTRVYFTEEDLKYFEREGLLNG